MLGNMPQPCSIAAAYAAPPGLEYILKTPDYKDVAPAALVVDKLDKLNPVTFLFQPKKAG
jgi:hypothetical protein